MARPLDDEIEQAARAGYATMMERFGRLTTPRRLPTWEEESDVLRDDWRAAARAMLAVRPPGRAEAPTESDRELAREWARRPEIARMLARAEEDGDSFAVYFAGFTAGREDLLPFLRRIVELGPQMPDTTDFRLLVEDAQDVLAGKELT